MNRWILHVIGGIVIILGIGCSNNSAEDTKDRFDSGTLHISCDESFKPVLDAQVQVYENEYPKANIIMHYKPEADCLRDMLTDSIKLIIATRGPSAKERKSIIDSLRTDVRSITVAYDAIAVIVNPANADSFFTLKEISDLLTGSTKKNLIPVMDGLKATSTVRFMLDSLLRGKSLGKGVTAADNSLEVINYVAQTPNAVGFIGVSWIGNTDDTAQLGYLKKVRLARLESTDSVGGYVWPLQYLIYSKTYPLIRDLAYINKESHAGLAHGFVNFLSGDRGQLIFRRSYLFPALRPFYNREARLE